MSASPAEFAANRDPFCEDYLTALRLQETASIMAEMMG
jgi:hypothetical protein